MSVADSSSRADACVSSCRSEVAKDGPSRLKVACSAVNSEHSRTEAGGTNQSDRFPRRNGRGSEAAESGRSSSSSPASPGGQLDQLAQAAGAARLWKCTAHEARGSPSSASSSMRPAGSSVGSS